MGTKLLCVAGRSACVFRVFPCFGQFGRCPGRCRCQMDVRCGACVDTGGVPGDVYLPLAHGTNVAPSGRLPTLRNGPGGSLVFGVSAPWRALQMMSFNAKNY